MARRSWDKTKEFSKRVSPNALADIREEALLAFFNRFCEKEVDTIDTRKSRRKVVHWLDSNNVKIQEPDEGHDFVVLIPTQSTAMYVHVGFEARKNLYKYQYELVHKRNLYNDEEE